MNNSIHIPNWTIGQSLKSTMKWKIYNIHHNLSHHTAKVIVVHKLHTHLSDDAKQFLNLLEKIKSFDHVNYLKLLQIHEDSKRYYLITDQFEGVTLKQFVITKGKLKSKKQLNKIIFQLISIIQYFHSKKFYHGCINPELIHINENLEIKLETFGFLFSENKKVTATGANKNFSLLFTNKNISQQFLAPELTTLEPRISKKTDIWSLGLCTLFMILDQKRFNKLFDGNKKYQKLDKVKIPKWVGKNLKVLIKQMVQINFQKRVWLHDQQFLQFCNDLKSVNIDFDDNINTNKQDENEIVKNVYESKTISRNGLQSKLNNKNIRKSLIEENDDSCNSISCLMNQDQTLISHDERSVINQNNKINSPFNYNHSSTGEEKGTCEHNTYKNDLELDITSNDEIIFQNNFSQLNGNPDSLNNIFEIKIRQNANFSSNVKDCSNNSIRKEKNKTNKSYTKCCKTSKIQKIVDQNIIKKKEKCDLNCLSSQNKYSNARKTIKENIQKKHKAYINNVLSGEKDNLGKKFSPRQMKRILKRNALNKKKNSVTKRGNFNTYSNKKMGLRQTFISMKKFQLKNEKIMGACHIRNNSINPISHQFSKSMDYTRKLSNNSSSLNQKSISENALENILSSNINEILNSSISHKKRNKLEKGYLKALQKLGIFYTKVKKNIYVCTAQFRGSILNFKISFVKIPNRQSVSRVNFVRLNCNLWDFYALFQEIDKCLQLN